MSIGSFLIKGNIMPTKDTKGNRLCMWIGRKLAMRHKNVFIDPTAIIDMDARIHPRKNTIRIGAYSSVAPHAAVQGNVEIGDHSSVQYTTMVVGYADAEGKGKITIGNGVRIAGHCMIISANHRYEDPDTPIHKQGMNCADITIEDDVWIGGGVHINAGVTIGKGCVIGAGSVVTHDIPPYSVAVGVPARVIKKREKKVND